MTKQNILITAALLIIIAVFGYFGYRGYQYASIDVREYESFDAFLEAGHTSDREIAIYTEKLKEAYEQDTYGSTTPEGTFDLFIAALEEDDLELASKYFVVEYQILGLKELEEAKKNKILPIFLGGARNNVEVHAGETYSQIDVLPEGEDTPFVLELKFNSYADIWKIESL